MRQIDADALTEVLNDVILNDPNCPIFVAAAVEQYIDLAPTVDVVPVQHGRWIPHSEWVYGIICSECSTHIAVRRKSDIGSAMIVNRYCRNCGARMEGGDAS